MNKNVLEWAVFGASLALIATVVGLLLHEHFTTGSGPAEITITMGRPVAVGGAYALPLDIRNHGDTTAEDVRVAVTLNGEASEATDVTLPYVPYRSQRRAWVTFSRDPASGKLAARVLGYREP